ncbi:hypothetical protein DW668_10375 [Bacteroides stercoris]|jgi:hypothetical protein|uniref:NigD-like protein n=2 Tax=Bacteroides stercoris TaxID=46506 RepID=A0A414Q3L0_BACSE|nr:hypothetical protein [Bacteroides stercoris]RHF75371.1 hypothetical protein DW668_10375 [Bacteroides stercoris]HAX58054.1 hypothetical protein [Bacteroides stercoris]
MFMKQLKFLMVAFTLLMGVSFTSCLNDDAGESMYDGIGYVRTVMGNYFVDLYGNTYHPTMASVTEMEAQGFKMSGTDLAQIAFKYVEDTPATKAEGGTFTPQDYRIKLVSAIAVDSYSTKHVSSVENMEMEAIPETAPIVTLEPTDNYGQTYKPWMYGAEMLVLPISWKMENKEEMLKQHTMELVYINDESNESSTELVFYLRHNKGTDTKTDVFAVRNKAYDVRQIMSDFKGKHGSYPTTIRIKAKTDMDGAKLPEKYTDYTIENFKWNPSNQ